MRAWKAATGIPLFAWFAILVLFILAGPNPALAVTYVHQTPLSFKWAPPKIGAKVNHYNVYVSVDGEPLRLRKEVAANTCQIYVKDGRTYVLRVEAEDATGQVGPMSDPSVKVAVYLNGSPDDTDGDGMANSWETSHGLNPFDPADAGADPDRDGLTNLAEYQTGTDPLDRDTDDDGQADGVDPYPLGLSTDTTNGPPVVEAGPDQVLNPTVVTLDGSRSHDPDRNLLSYSWTQRSGPEVTLSDSHGARPTFLGKKEGDYVFELVVRDKSLASLADKVVITIRNVPPSADAGPDREVSVGSEVLLDGSGSADPNEDPLRFVWGQRSGPEVSLEGALNEVASFVPELAGVYTFQLVTFDGRFFSVPDEVQVIANSPANSVPRANAGQDMIVQVGETVTLDGSGSSDPDGDPLLYSWSEVKGPRSVVLEGASDAQAEFEGAVKGTYGFQLIVNDGELSSPPDTVSVKVRSKENQVPVAVVAAASPVSVGDWVVLDGSESYDPDGTGYLGYSWTQKKGPAVALEDGDSTVAGFYAVTKGTVAFDLVVGDGESESEPASVELQVLDAPSDQDGSPSPRQVNSDGGGGCSVGLRASGRHEVSASDIGYVLTLFLPAIGAGAYRKRTLRIRHSYDRIHAVG